MGAQGIVVRHGVAPEHRDQAVNLFWQAFSQKLAPIMKPEAKAMAFLKSVMAPDHAISAMDEKGRLLGIAGYKTSCGAFIDGGLVELRSVYGAWGGWWRGMVLSLLERDIEPDTLLMDGIFVDAAVRGRGVGTVLLNAVAETARQHGLSKVRLDVIDSNPRARKLYETLGFRAVETHDIGPLRYLFGFRAATTMHRDLGPVPG